jgi:hypothetical protein
VNAINPSSNGAQLWKAIASSNDDSFFLRSAESFNVNQSNGTMPSLLVGYGATGAPLDLGYVPSYSSESAIYWGQSDSPTGNNGAFTEWTYNTSNAQLTNSYSGGQIYNASPETVVGTGSSAPANQWYAYPSYYTDQVVSEPNSAPPFPAANTPGEEAAYAYLSSRFVPGEQLNCTIEGTAYTGIRCEYSILSATATLETCASTSLSWSDNPASLPDSYNGTAISEADYSAVLNQLYLECQYAADVQTTFTFYDQIINYVFINSSTSLPQLAIDLGLSQSQSINVVPIEIIEGVLYTGLSATGTQEWES